MSVCISTMISDRKPRTNGYLEIGSAAYVDLKSDEMTWAHFVRAVPRSQALAQHGLFNKTIAYLLLMPTKCEI